MMKENSIIYVAGHQGLVGSAIVRALLTRRCKNLILKTRSELDLLNQSAVASFFEKEKPEFVFLAAAKVGGIIANNDYPADFIYENLIVQTNVLHSAHKNGVKKLLFLGSSCIYPRLATQPMKEESLLSGLLEPTNQAYAVAKIAGIMTCQSFHKQYGSNFISVMPTNLYGQNDNFDLQSSHVLPALVRKFHTAKMTGANNITLWGSGAAMREFLAVDDLADALLLLIDQYDSPEIINVGAGEDITIKELADIIKTTVNFTGTILWDNSKPDGTPRKLLDSSKINKLGWHPKIPLQQGIKQLYDWYLQNNKAVRKNRLSNFTD